MFLLHESFDTKIPQQYEILWEAFFDEDLRRRVLEIEGSN